MRCLQTCHGGFAVVLSLTIIGSLAAHAQDSQRPAIPAIDQSVAPYLAAGEFAGAVTLVTTPSEIVHGSACGLADIDTKRSMTSDAIFWIASMSKPITATAVMMLQDEGKLSVDDPVARHIPEFGQIKDAQGRPVVVTIRHLLTHTSGLADLSRDQAAAIPDLQGIIAPIVAQPVRFAPGSKWAYCQSGINTAARVVEVVSGQPFPEFLSGRLLEPLGMTDTTFYLTEAQLPRLATPYARGDDGTLVAAANPILYGKSPTSRDRYPAANGGLFSTAGDYARFCQMILNDGELDGRRYLTPEAIKQMTSVQTGDLVTGFTPGNGWGLGWCVVRAPQGRTAALAPGSFGHGGAFGTQAWIDPVAKRAYILMVQRANFPNSDDSLVREAFQSAAAQALGSTP